jgi:hypothetical protein
MSAATPRLASNAPEQRFLLLALGAIVLAIAIVVALAIARPAAAPAPKTVAAPAPAVFDHGWSSAENGSSDLVIRGTNGGGVDYTGIPQPAIVAMPSNVIVTDTPSGGLQVRFGASERSLPSVVGFQTPVGGQLPYSATEKNVGFQTPVGGQLPYSATDNVGFQTPVGGQLPYSATDNGPTTHGGQGTRFAR